MKINWLDWGYRLGTLALVLVLALTLVACSTTWVVDLENYLPVAIRAATGIISILVSTGALGPVIPAEVAAAEAAVTTGLQLLCGTPVNNQCNPTSLVGQFNSGSTAVLSQLQAALESVQTNLQTWLSLIHIKAAGLQATISAAISLVLTAIAAIAARVGSVIATGAQGAKAVAQAITKTPKMPISSVEFKAQFNQIVTTGGFASAVIL